MKKIIKYLLLFLIFIILIVIGINVYIIILTKTSIKKQEDINDSDVDCILVLGAGIRGNSPSPMLEDRLLTSIELYNNHKSSKIIVSGDHGKNDYDEVNVMKDYLIEHGIPSEDIFMDHAGFSTYDSIYRAKNIFESKKIIIVSQEYHLYRALYISRKLDIEAYGVSANLRKYMFQIKRDIREIAARVKDYIKCIIKPQSKYLGEIIPVSGNGNVTNDR